tara:strand:+ start:1572 stop:2588 length:1017 start_codon:yes stop_codon:yes gene_type:complete
MMIRLFIFSFLLLSPFAHAINVLSINTELTQGQKAVTTAGSKALVENNSNSDEVESYVTLINNSKADIVGLTESADKRLAENMVQSLGGEWQLVVRENRNSSTGLRVSILSRLAIIKGSITNLADQYGFSRHEKHRAKPDAIIAAGFELDDKRYFTVVSYLTAGKGDYAEVRYAQADAVRNGLFTHCREKYDHCILMGNMNDEPGSQAVKRIQGVDGIFGDKVALHQAKLMQGSGPMKTYGDGISASQGDQIMSTLQGTASLYPLDPSFSTHQSLLFISRDPLESEKPSKKIKRDRKKMAAYYKTQHLQQVVEKQKSYIDTLEIEKANLQQLLNTSGH